MDKHRAILARDSFRRQHDQKQRDHGDHHDNCIEPFCFPPPAPFPHPTFSTPKPTTTIISKPSSTPQTIPAVTKLPQTPAPVTTKQQTTSAGIVTSHPVSPSLSSLASDPAAGTSNSQSLASIDSTGSRDLNQNPTTQKQSSFSVYHILTTDSNGYTIDVTSTSFFAPGATSGLGANGEPANSSRSASSNVGPIVGGAVGAISFILLVLFAMWFIRQRRKNRTAPSAEFLSSSKYPFTGSSEFLFRRISDSVDQQSISEYPFEHPPPHGGTESPKSFLHMREKSETY